MWHVAAAIRSQSTSFPCPPPSPATQSIALLGHRLNYYARHNILLYCVDLCYWVHACGLQALWRSDAAQPGDPTAPNEWALASMLSAVGPVGGAVFMLQSPLLLHHPEVCGHAYSTFPCRRAHGTRRTPGPPQSVVWPAFLKLLPYKTNDLTPQRHECQPRPPKAVGVTACRLWLCGRTYPIRASAFLPLTLCDLPRHDLTHPPFALGHRRLLPFSCTWCLCGLPTSCAGA